VKRRISKLSFILGLVGITTSLLLIPVGFSTWSFLDGNNKSKSIESNIVVVEDYIDYGTYNLTSTSYPSLIVLEEGTGSSSSDISKGITFYQKDDSWGYLENGVITCTFTVTQESYLDYVKHLEFGIQLTFTNTSLNNYVEIINITATSNGYFIPFSYIGDSNGDIIFTKDTSTTPVSYISEELSLDLNSYFKWKENMKPDSSEKYQKIKEEINGKDTAITITFLTKSKS